VVKAVVLGFFERLPDRDLLLDSEESDEADAEIRDIDYNELAPPRRLWWPGAGSGVPSRGVPETGDGSKNEWGNGD
jgi:hypothetical protein